MKKNSLFKNKKEEKAYKKQNILWRLGMSITAFLVSLFYFKTSIGLALLSIISIQVCYYIVAGIVLILLKIISIIKNRFVPYE